MCYNEFIIKVWGIRLRVRMLVFTPSKRVQVPYPLPRSVGPVVRIEACHAFGRGSIPLQIAANGYGCL